MVSSAPIPKNDRSVLRRLAERKAAIAALAVQRRNIAEWTRLNRLERGKPLVWMHDIPWNELGGPELDLQCSEPVLRWRERFMRQELYQWDHMRGDMVVEGKILSPLHIRDTGFGLPVKLGGTLPDGGITDIRFEPVIREEKDLEKIRTPEVSLDEEATERAYARDLEIFGDILPVEKVGVRSWWFAPWDILVTWWGVQEALMDLAVRPELIHAAMDRLTNAFLSRLDQLEALNALSLNHSCGVGPAGLGYTDQLPQSDFDGKHVRPRDMWGMAAAQIFTEVGPEMHEEFALRYEKHWTDRFGLVGYGCCEALHKKIRILEKLPNLRRISMSPWANVEEGASQMGDRYVFSYKPTPAILAAEKWDLDYARTLLRDALDKTRGCIVEVIMKDITTVAHQPERLWEWARMAAQLTEEYA